MTSENVKSIYDEYGQIPLNFRQKSVIQVISGWNNITNKHIKCVKTILKCIKNVLYNPFEDRFRKIKLSNKKMQKLIFNVNGGIKLFYRAGFEKKTNDNNEDIIVIEPPNTSEQLEQLTEILIVLKYTLDKWEYNANNTTNNGNAKKKFKFELEDTLKINRNNFFKGNDILKVKEFKDNVQASNDPNVSYNSQIRYNYFGKSIQVLLNKGKLNFNYSNDNFLNTGLDDFDTCDIGGLLTMECLTNVYDDDDEFLNLILAQDIVVNDDQKNEVLSSYNNAVKMANNQGMIS